MATTIWGVVKDGRIVTNSPLPEGACVEIRVCEGSPEMPPDLREELEPWDLASAKALDLIERLAGEGPAE
jgi:hypothetical protein